MKINYLQQGCSTARNIKASSTKINYGRAILLKRFEEEVKDKMFYPTLIWYFLQELVALFLAKLFAVSKLTTGYWRLTVNWLRTRRKIYWYDDSIVVVHRNLIHTGVAAGAWLIASAKTEKWLWPNNGGSLWSAAGCATYSRRHP